MAVKYVADQQRWHIARQNTAEATKKLLVEAAKRLHSEVMRKDPRPRTFYRLVDNQAGLKEEQVSAYGRIDYFYPRIDEIVQFAMETLYKRSPVDSGDYRNSHMLFIDGVAAKNLEGRRRGQEVSISNPLPYSRKIEVGAMTMRVSGTDHVYEESARIVRARYKDVADIKFTFRGVAGGFGRGANKINRDTRQPVMLITERV